MHLEDVRTSLPDGTPERGRNRRAEFAKRPTNSLAALPSEWKVYSGIMYASAPVKRTAVSGRPLQRSSPSLG